MVQHVSTAPVTTAPGATALDQLEKAGLKKHRSLWNNAWRQFRHHRLALIGLIVFISLVLITFVGAMIYPRDKDYIDFMVTSLPPFQSWKYHSAPIRSGATSSPGCFGADGFPWRSA
jgi:hypothetical protein